MERVYPDLEFRDRYSARERNLYELVFYEGIVNIEDMRVDLIKLRSILRM